MYEFINEKDIEKVIFEHVVNAKKVEDGSKELLKDVYEKITSRILLQIKLYLENSNNYKSTEKVYNDTNNFKKRYLEYLEFDNSVDISTENEKEILRGVFKSIRGASKEFPDYKNNPLEYERLLIESRGLGQIKEAMKTIQEEVVNSFELPTSLNVSLSDLLHNHMNDSYLMFYDKLNEMVMSKIEELNDLKLRVELNHYIKFLQAQESMLKNFIYINLEIGEERQVHHESLELTVKYIDPLKQLCQDIQTTLSDINHVINKKIIIEPMEIKNINRIIESNIQKDKRLKELIKLIDDDKHNRIDRIMLHINDELTKISTLELNKIKKASNRFELLSYIILELFEDCLQCISSFHFDKIDDDLHKKIVKGVTDTLHLKYDSLKEKDAYYHLMKKQCYLESNKSLLKFKIEFEQTSEAYLEEAIEGSNASFNQSQVKFVRLLDKEKEESLTYDLDYFKKDILFEIKTLEDLMYQSIDKLKVSKEDVCITFVECIDKMYHNILVQLKRNDILSIMPKEHEIFNGKLHEILIAEKCEGYEKGEIIRSQNRGFIFENRILVRASVIAAK